MSKREKRQEEEMSSVRTGDESRQRGNREQKAHGPCSHQDGERYEEVCWEEWIALAQFTQGFEFSQ